MALGEVGQLAEVERVARRRVAAEDRDRVVRTAGDNVGESAVRRELDARGGVQTGDPADAILEHLQERELAEGRRESVGLAGEHRHGVAEGAGDVDVVPVRTDADAARAVETVDAADALLLDLEPGEL